MTTLERLKHTELNWNKKDGTIEVADDLAGTNKVRVIAEMRDREYGEALVNAANAFVELVEALEYLVKESDDDMDDDYNPHAAPLAKARAALEWAKE